MNSDLIDVEASSEFLAFRLGREEYGIDILNVREIRSYEAPTRIANAPVHVKGVVNLRGTILPIIDLRVKFAQEEVRYDDQTVVIIVDVQNRTTGIVIDGVSDVLTLGPEQIKPAPVPGGMNTDYIRGLGSVENRMLILIDIEKLIDTEELTVPDEAVAG